MKIYGVVVDLGNDIEGFVPMSQLGVPNIENPGDAAREGQLVDLKVLEVDPIHHRIENLCRDLGYEAETRDFTPHITIGRVRPTGAPSTLVDQHLSAQIEPVEFEVSSIVIYESILERTGSVYSKVDSFQFKSA